MNTITIQFCEEDRKRIDELISLAGQLVGEFKAHPVGCVELAQDTAPLQTAEVSVGLPVEGAAPVEPVTVVEETPVLEAEPVAEPTPEVKPVSLAEFQKAVTLAVSKGATQKQKVKEVINRYASSVSGVPEDKRAEVMEALAKL